MAYEQSASLNRKTEEDFRGGEGAFYKGYVPFAHALQRDGPGVRRLQEIQAILQHGNKGKNEKQIC